MMPRRATPAPVVTASTVMAPVVAALALVACGTPAPSTGGNGAPAPLSVVATTDVYGSIVSAVGGDAVEVTSIIDSPGADPHEYESTPADAAAVNRARLVVLNGADYDPFADRLIAAAGTRPTVVDVSELSGLRAQVPPGEEFNEHVWYSLPTVQELAETVAADLGAADPASAATFTANAAAFHGRIDGLIAEVDAIRARHAGTRVAVTEPVPLYLVEAAGLENATPEAFSEAVEEGGEVPAAVVADVLALVEGPQAVRALLTGTQTEDAATRRVEAAATAGNVPIVPVTETLPAGVPDYVTWMSQQIDALRAALDRPAA